jgi:signal transduction histidine kinase
VLDSLMKMYSGAVSAHLRAVDNIALKNKQQDSDQLLIDQRKLAEMGEMVGAITHQIKQPLNNIYLNVQLLQENDYTQEEHDNLAQINEQVEFMSETIDDFRLFFQNERE